MKHTSPIRKIAAGSGVCLVTCMAAVHSYMSAGWGFVDSVYMVIITIFGIGYGEVNPVSSPLMKMQTMILIVVGCLSGIYTIGGFIQLCTEGEIQRALGKRKTSKELKRMKNHTIICGFGRVGKMLAKELELQRVPFVIVDSDAERMESARDDGYTVVVGDASSESVLEEAGIQRAKTLACVLPNDAINVFITLTAVDLNDSLEVIARAESPETERKLRRSGADHVVMPAAIGAVRMAQIIEAACHGPDWRSCKHRLKTVPVAGVAALEEQTLAMAKKALDDIGAVVGIQRADRSIVTEMDDRMELGPEDILLVTEQRQRQRPRRIGGKAN